MIPTLPDYVEYLPLPIEISEEQIPVFSWPRVELIVVTHVQI